MPEPVPLVDLLSAIVGFWLVLQHTPLSVTDDPPSFVIVPPLLAVVEVIADSSDVVKTGISANVVNFTWLLYAVPTEFKA